MDESIRSPSAWLAHVAKSVWVLLPLALASSNHARAEYLSIPVVVGQLPGAGAQVDFDFGRTFVEIDSISLIVSAATTPYVYESCGTISMPEPCVMNVYAGGIDAMIVDGQDIVAFGSLKDFSETGLTQGRMLRFWSGAQIDLLLDGTATLLLSMNTVASGDAIIHVIAEPTVEILSFGILVDGIPVPEPAPSIVYPVSIAWLMGMSRLRKERRDRATFVIE